MNEKPVNLHGWHTTVFPQEKISNTLKNSLNLFIYHLLNYYYFLGSSFPEAFLVSFSDIKEMTYIHELKLLFTDNKI